MSEIVLPSISEFIAQVSPLNSLPVSAQKTIASHLRIRYLAAGETLPFDASEEERWLYVVRTGALEQRWRDGVLRARLGPEDLFGFTFLEGIPGNPEDCYNVTALQNTLLYQIPHSLLKNLLNSYPEYATHFSINAHERLGSAMNVVWSNDEKGLFVRKVADVASDVISVVQSDTTIQQTAWKMRGVDRCSTAVVMEDGQIVGIITDRDMSLRVVAQGVDASRPVKEVMTPSPVTIGPNELIMQAVALMMQHGIRGLPVVNQNRPVGLLTTSHLVQHHRVQAIFLIEKINHCNTVDELAALAVERQAVFEALVEGNLHSESTHLVMTMIMDACTRKLINLAIQHLGTPPCEYAWLVAGSHARNEVHMMSDQDSALVLADTATESDIIWFMHMAMYVSNGLDMCGYPLCTGNYMAASRRWCQPVHVWQEYFKKWVRNPEYSQLLNATVFLETRALAGNVALCETVQQTLLDSIAKSPGFLRALTRDAVQTSPPLGIFNNLVLEKSGSDTKTLNIKRYALTLIIDLARIYALAAGCSETRTEVRFIAARDKGLLSPDSCTNIIDTFHFLTRQRLLHQCQQIRQGHPADNQINPQDFGSFERKHLKDAFRIISGLQDAAKLRFVKE
ncbi:putative nucleotidyltransferase substrate binding domain-containing protein [Mangrovibacter plantisponsor]|uniref:CBS domain-containing protein n=1 Tax=Mangrovibacter plantisponsor TaxID=451513 RepID=A0A317PZB5_9ENTR|nr:putative nucleotidyltransferase substrate binding domain-containing protein [Mangrovibacter plantisponsor]PWW08062.1 CBS domain-containing protein [Mangrovibacter plantisponsor]